MKPVIFIIKRRFTKKEVVFEVYVSFQDVTTYRELNRLINEKHVRMFGQSILDIEREYGSEIDEDIMADERQTIAQSIGEELGLQKRLDELEIEVEKKRTATMQTLALKTKLKVG